LSFPGLLKALFGKTLERIEKPYYTFIDEYVIFSNHPQTLKNIIDDYEKGMTLENSDEFNNFAHYFDNKNNAYSYFDIPVLFNNMKEFVNNDTWMKLNKNKPYVTSFPQAGVQIDEKNNLLHVLIKATYDENIEDIAEQRFDINSFMNLFEDENEVNETDPHYGWDSPNIIIQDLDANVVREFFKDDKIKFEVSLKNGLIHGTYKAYYRNGQLMVRGKYQKDLREGKWKLYDEEGNLTKEKLFSEDKEISN
jgi:antitoxin component YwqK of YwqJK toxin-antitoxin module